MRGFNKVLVIVAVSFGLSVLAGPTASADPQDDGGMGTAKITPEGCFEVDAVVTAIHSGVFSLTDGTLTDSAFIPENTTNTLRLEHATLGPRQSLSYVVGYGMPGGIFTQPLGGLTITGDADDGCQPPR
jgi:hypothetical protein